MKRLPIGIQHFPTLIERDDLCVDKSELVYRMLQEGVAYFLSRPRRFGKSLLASTLASVLRGQKKLFEGLWIAGSDYDWSPCSVIALDFGLTITRSPERLTASLHQLLQNVAGEFDIDLAQGSRPATTLRRLVKDLRKRGRVALVIDECDRPIFKNLGNLEVVQANQEILLDFFASIKSLQSELSFVFITGVGRFSKASLFTGMNHLQDISLSPHYATLAGITEGEMNQYFDEHVLQLAESRQQSPDEIFAQLQHWYNGYRFSGAPDCESVFNPWSVLNCLATGEIRNYWFSSGRPTFAIDMIKRRQWSAAQLDLGIPAGEEIETDHDPDQLQLVPLLFQTGYLTIERYDADSRTYHLRPPNEEVLRSLIDHLLSSYSEDEDSKTKTTLFHMKESLKDSNLEDFFTDFNRLLASIPHPLHIACESYYHSILYLYIRSLGFFIQAEVVTHRERIDLLASLPERAYIFEFKIDRPVQEAISQIKELDYAKQFEGQGKEIILVGANFSSKTRNVDDWVQENVSAEVVASGASLPNALNLSSIDQGCESTTHR